jgi:hypothetical protein
MLAGDFRRAEYSATAASIQSVDFYSHADRLKAES